MNLNPLSFVGDIFAKVADKISPDKGKIIDGQNHPQPPCFIGEHAHYSYHAAVARG